MVVAGNHYSAAITVSDLSYIHKSLSSKDLKQYAVTNYVRYLYTWGDNSHGCLGTGTTDISSYHPQRVSVLSKPLPLHNDTTLDTTTITNNTTNATTTPHSAVCSFSVLSVSLGSFHSAAIVEYTQQSELIEFRLLGDEPSSIPFTYGYRYLFTWGNNSSGQVLKYRTIILLYIILYTIYYILIL
jgi:hypothetical protein